MRKSLKVIISMAFVLAASNEAFAWKIVFDPSNFSKNAVTAVQQVRQTAIQAATMANTANQYIAMVRNMRQLSPEIIAAGVARGVIPAGDYKTTGEVLNAAQGVYGSYKAVTSNMDAYNKTFTAINGTMSALQLASVTSKVAPERILQYDYQKAKDGQVQGQNYYTELQSLNSQLEQHKVRSDALASSLPQQSSTVGLLQTIGTQNALMHDQLSQLIQVSTISAAQTIEANRNKYQNDENNLGQRGDMLKIESQAKNYFTKK